MEMIRNILHIARKFIVSFFLLTLLLGLPTNSAFAEGVATDPSDKLEQELLLSMPAETENPNFTITFTDPSGAGVFLTIDGKDEVEIKNPYTLPSLGIGKHSLKFRFTDKSGSEQSVEDSIVITPRPTEISAPEIVEGKIRVSGNAVALADVLLFISGGKLTERGKTTVGEDGKWVHTFDGEFTPGVYTIVGYVKKGGFASAFSEPKTFQIDDGTPEPVENIENPQSTAFSIADFTVADFSVRQIASDVKNNPESAIFIGAFLLLGIITGMLLVSIFTRGRDKSTEKMLKEVFASKSKTPEKTKDAKGENEKESIKNKLSKSEVKAEKGAKDKEHIEIDLEKERKSEKKEEQKPQSEAEKKKESAEVEKITKKLEESNREEGNDDEKDRSKEEEKKESLTEKLKKAEIEFSKDEFLKEYKAFDPDPKKGGTKGEDAARTEKGKDKTASKKDAAEKAKPKEKRSGGKTSSKGGSEKEDRNIKITLTSDY